jgi:uncharacterized membrane protein
MSPSAVERAVARVLLWGGLLSVSLMLLGLALYAGQGHSHVREVMRVVQNRAAGRAVDVFTSLGEVCRALRQRPPDALAIATLGLLCLLATPVVGVAVSAVWFWRERDRRYALISAVVLAMLLVSLAFVAGSNPVGWSKHSRAYGPSSVGPCRSSYSFGTSAISMRRFLARPSTVALSATGLYSP